MRPIFVVHDLGSPARVSDYSLSERDGVPDNDMSDNHSGRLAELAEQHGQMVFATAYRILGNADEAEDALQEVFLKMLSCRSGPAQLDAVRDWGAYLRVAASTAAVDLLRRKSRRRREKAGLDSEPVGSIDDDPARLADQRETVVLLRQALATLPARDAAVFTLRHFEDLSYRCIAQQMELTTDQVGVILHRSRKRLRDLLRPAQNVGRKSAKEDRSV